MSEASRIPADADPAAREPSRWITRFAHLVPSGARVLDVACGHGRHARFFAARGCPVVAVDRDCDALRALDEVAGVCTREVDLESGPWPFVGQSFDAIVVANYLHRPLFVPLLEALSDDGALFYETFARGNETYGRPRNPDFLLVEGELLRWLGDRLTVVAFEQGIEESGDRRAVVQRIAAVGRGRKLPVQFDAPGKPITGANRIG